MCLHKISLSHVFMGFVAMIFGGFLTSVYSLVEKDGASILFGDTIFIFGMLAFDVLFRSIAQSKIFELLISLLLFSFVSIAEYFVAYRYIDTRVFWFFIGPTANIGFIPIGGDAYLPITGSIWVISVSIILGIYKVVDSYLMPESSS